MYDGSNYYPMSKWVLFGHHFAAIAGAVMAGAMHNQIILLASVKHDGQSLVEVARAEINKTSGITASIDVLIILVVALAGLGMVSQPNKQWGSNINDAPPSNIDYNSGRGY
jgi:carbon starvation protein